VNGSRWLAAVLASGGFLSACTAMSPAADTPELNGTAWVLTALPGQALLPDASVTARFEGGRVQGTDGCNRYSSPYTLDGSTLQVGPRGVSTQMACAPAVMKQADAFMSALAGARSNRIAAGELQLLTAGGTVLATLAAQSQALSGTAWRVTGYNLAGKTSSKPSTFSVEEPVAIVAPIARISTSAATVTLTNEPVSIILSFPSST